MRPAEVARTAAVLVLTMASGAGCAGDLPGARGCSGREEAQVERLAGLPILRAHPAAAEPAGAYSGCGADDSGDPIDPHAGRRYRATLDEVAIRSYYWDEVTRDGWRNASADIPPSVAPALAFQRGVSCLVKDVDGEQAVVTLRFEQASSAYAVEVTIPGEGQGCA